MQAIRDYFIVIATAGIVVSVIETLLPEGQIGKTAKFVTALFMILMVFSPVAALVRGISNEQTKLDYKLPEAKTEAFYSTEIRAEIEKGIAEKAVQIAAQYGVLAEAAKVSLSVDTAGNIFVNEIVLLDKGSASAAARDAVLKKLKEELGASAGFKENDG